MTAAILNTIHNIQFYLDTMEAIREAICFGQFQSFRRRFLERLGNAAP
jgi:queuine tRNA-ribosyltransferase